MAPEDDAIAEAAWFLSLGQRPIFTFTVGDDPNQLVSSTLQWVGSSTEPKSWLHTCIFLGGSTDTLENLLSDNLRLCEARSLQRLSADLDGQTKRLVALLSNYTQVTASDLEKAVKSIAAITATWPTGMHSTRLSLEGFAQLGEGLNLFSAEDAEDEATEEPVFKLSRKVVPLELTGGGASFEGVLMRLTKADDGHLLFSTEHRNYPFIFRLHSNKIRESIIDLWFDVDKSNITQALRFEALIKAIKGSRAVSLISPSGELAVLTLG